jgi:hypothetical protein
MSETNCIATTNAARAEWRTLSHASSLRPSQRIRTSDGRELAGSQLNYSSVLIGRAESACLRRPDRRRACPCRALHFDPRYRNATRAKQHHLHSFPDLHWDNYTNNGIVASLQIDPNLMVQFGLSDGTETPIWNCCRSLPNLFGPNPLYNGPNYRRDPGNQPTATACVRVSWNDGWDNFYPCMNGFNNGAWGYNNLQWSGFTYYHRFNDQWHIDFESYYEFENGVPNLRTRRPSPSSKVAERRSPRKTCSSTRRTWRIAATQTSSSATRIRSARSSISTIRPIR